MCEHAAPGSDRCEGHVYEYVGTQPFSNCERLEQGPGWSPVCSSCSACRLSLAVLSGELSGVCRVYTDTHGTENAQSQPWLPPAADVEVRLTD